MNFIGLDLAWGELAWTGVAVLDADGRLRLMTRVRTDDDILDAVAPYLDGPVLVSIDAPLIVENASGRRPCESQVSSLFGRFHAGAHSSNLSLPSFRNGPRGGRVAALIGLDVAPNFAPQQPARRAIEVYPHAATVTLFGLERVLPYKAKPGRDPARRRGAMLDLVQHVDGLAARTPRLDVSGSADWATARDEIASASTHAQLNRWEDALDAVVCAYIGLHRWWHGDAESAVLGDVATGYIVVPLDDRVRREATAPVSRLSNAELEALAVSLVTKTALRAGRSVQDTRHMPDAVGDLLVDERAVEIKASAGSVRGEDLWLEPSQAEGLRQGHLDLVLVEHVRADGSGTVRWFDTAALQALLPRLREQHYFILPLPVAAYDALEARSIPPD
jgi:predicted RNase H-like nuclease